MVNECIQSNEVSYKQEMTHKRNIMIPFFTMNTPRKAWIRQERTLSGPLDMFRDNGSGQFTC